MGRFKWKELNLNVFFNMPDPAFGIQLVYNNTAYPELVTVVRDGDAVLMPSGFHPNVSVPVIASRSFVPWRLTGKSRIGSLGS
jgi:hypothetical protein